MKAERRHELQHNELADWLAEAIQRIKPYSRAIAGVALAAAVLLTAYVVLSRRAESKQSTAWNDYYQALQSPSNEGLEADLEAIAREHQGVVAGLWAAVSLADIQLDEGVRSFFLDRRAAEEKLRSASAHYETAIERADDPLLKARALYGLGRAQESLGQLDDAKATYRQVADASAGDAYQSLAKLRLDDLGRDSTKEFYAWFAQQEPASAGSSLLPGTPGERFPFDESSLGLPGDTLSGENILNIPGLNKGPALTNGETSTDSKEAATPDGTATKTDGKDEPKDGAKQDARQGASDEGNATKDSTSADPQSPAADEKPPTDQDKASDAKSTEPSKDDSTSAGTSKNQK